MSLRDKLDALRAELVRSAPPSRTALYDAKVEELRLTFRIDRLATLTGIGCDGVVLSWVN
jgi:hypothetical protein